MFNRLRQKSRRRRLAHLIQKGIGRKHECALHRCDKRFLPLKLYGFFSRFAHELSRQFVDSLFGAMTSRTCFFVRECPCSDRCSTQAWKRAAVWGYSQEEAREKLIKHLIRSGVHLLPKPDAALMANLAEYDSYEEEVEQVEGHQEEGAADHSEPIAKRPRPSASSVEQIVSATVRALTASNASSSISSNQSSSSVLMLRTPPPSMSMASISVPVSEVEAMMEITEKARDSALRANKLALSAARAFADEASALEAARINLRDMLNSRRML